MTLVISVWMVLCIRTDPRIPDCSNTKMSTARSEFGHLIRREERLPAGKETDKGKL